MAHKFDPTNVARLESPDRLALLPVEDVIAVAGVEPGSRVLDVGCGSGVFTVPLARAAGPAGEVLALDLRPMMVEACRQRVEREKLSNVIVSASEESRLPIPRASIDLVFASQLLHELEAPNAFLADVRRVLAPGGRLIVIEWEKVETPVGPPLEHRLTPAEARRMLETNGFTVAASHSITWANYLLIARPTAG